MKFNNVLNERIEDDVRAFARSNPDEINSLQKKLSKTASPIGFEKNIIKIELGGVDNDGRGSTFGDKIQIYDAYNEGNKITSVIGKTIRFGYSGDTKKDAFAICRLISPGDSIFANKLANFFIDIKNKNSLKKFAPTNKIFDVSYNTKTGEFTSKADI